MAEPPRQEDIDELMRALGADPGKAAPSTRAPSEPSLGAGAPGAVVAPNRPAVAAAPAEPKVAGPAARADSGLDFLSDVDVNVRIELGTARMHVQDVLKLGSGSVVPLESLVGDPVNVFVNDRLVAHGEVLVVNENFAVRITEVIPLPKAEK